MLWQGPDVAQMVMEICEHVGGAQHSSGQPASRSSVNQPKPQSLQHIPAMGHGSGSGAAAVTPGRMELEKLKREKEHALTSTTHR